MANYIGKIISIDLQTKVGVIMCVYKESFGYVPFKIRSDIIPIICDTIKRNQKVMMNINDYGSVMFIEVDPEE